MAERLNTREIAFLKKLNTPEKIQDFLDTLGYNYCHDKYICRSPKELLKLPKEERKAHCLVSCCICPICDRRLYFRHISMRVKTCFVCGCLGSGEDLYSDILILFFMNAKKTT